MFIGLSMWSFEKDAFAGKLTPADFIRYAAKEGYDAVELLDCFWKETDEEIAAAKKLAEECGIKIGCYSIGNDFAQKDPAARRQQVEYVKKGIQTAAKLGAPVLRVFGGSPKEGIAYADALPWIVEGFQACVPLAQEKGVVMAMENHGTLSGSGKQVREIIEKIGSPNFGATTDFGNFLLVDEDSSESVMTVLKYVKHVHCKDFAPAPAGEDRVYTSLAGKKFCGCVLGDGSANVAASLILLKNTGYKGMISIEYEGLEPAATGVPKCLEFVKKQTA
ncbi:MAG TPA: sugar phosphate isomerase/epimerase family protein [Candidatus Sumerlaeota bacterium]|nr:MAG: L-ribulose-5-phosphate 3-epimerase UlaE [candidate division BRC1 bacterium ADurb.Bin183]HOE62208.1 sugar phosphate isomerase/epimerase family protein [Candidatus Sumerlaeota bacterium]HRR30969.1 sugar phosphate isomerase/epimerase family protein [Candidatus Sumerlaeia bacterium]HON49123.1 sugar phosphate isomerase/epimerase family protein [Candidatus Sumerlaeota bacterium]HOR64270.1 sugar phosphate isomerase/epimerase family protein [Candidatus Sumerlaeota bacterium]